MEAYDCQWADKPDWAADLNPDSNPPLNWIWIRIMQDLNPDYTWTGFESGLCRIWIRIINISHNPDSNPDYAGFESGLQCLYHNPDSNPDYAGFESDYNVTITIRIQIRIMQDLNPDYKYFPQSGFKSGLCRIWIQFTTFLSYDILGYCMGLQSGL